MRAPLRDAFARLRAFDRDPNSMNPKQALSALPVVLSLSLAFPAAYTAAETTLSPVVVTAPAADAPLTVVTDPKAPRQPMPAHDGADFLKSIPGFSVIRKGGTDGDPLLRGMSGSRLGILLDGQEIYGGCGGRMDPPTAYVYPESYDRVTVLKGPQSVIHAAGASAGVVLFERDLTPLTEPGWSAYGSAILGSFGRNDQAFDVRGGTPAFQLRAGATRADADDYEDGDGTRIHSRYTRWSTHAALAWTPDRDTALELSMTNGDGEAAYADRAMDGVRFRRENVALKMERRNLSASVEKLWAQAYYNYADHVMDNFSLRDRSTGFAAMNPDRLVLGARAGVTLAPSVPLRVTLGVDAKRDTHRTRGAMNQPSGEAARSILDGLPYEDDMRFRQFGLFGEGSYRLEDGERAIAGLRVDRHAARDSRPCVDGMFMNGRCMMAPVNLTRGETARDTLTSGFVRYEGVFGNDDDGWYVGLGHVERFPDYWERLKRDETTLNSAFLTIRPEKTTQLDAGVNWSRGDWSASISGYYGKVDDYVQLLWIAPARTRNIDATILGVEGDLAWRFARRWTVNGTLAWVRGTNDTDDRPLAQQPPLEARLGLNYDDGTYVFGGLVRAVAAQNRVDVGSGNIVANGQDIGPSAGFAVFSLNAGWRAMKGLLITVGVDNVFDRTYAEHLSRTGASLPGFLFPADTRINEPGRTIWVKAQMSVD
jgi:iron complex outermembrane receptor protein